MTNTLKNQSSTERGTFFSEKMRNLKLVAALSLGPAALAGCAPGNVDAKPQTSQTAEAGAGDAETVNSGEVKIDTGNQTVEHAPEVTPENIEAVIASVRIDSSLSPEEKAKKLADGITQWLTAGATPESATQNRENVNNGVQPQNEAFSSEVASANDDAYAKGLMGENWQSNPMAAEFQAINTDNVTRYNATFVSEAVPAWGAASEEAYTESWSENVVLEGYATPSEVSLPILEGDKNEAADVLGDQPFTILSYNAVRTNNADKTTFSSEPSYAENNGRTIYVNALLVPEGGYDVVKYIKMSNEPIADIDYRSITQ